MKDSDVLKHLVTIAAGLPNPEFESTGGYLAIFKTNEAGEIVGAPEIMLGGTVPRKKQFGRITNAIEKSTRIIEHFLKHSFEKKDYRRKKWGGGIRYEFLVCAFSGFPERVDEAISLIYGVYKGTLGFGKEEFKKAVEKETAAHKHYRNNTFIPIMLEKFLAAI